MKKTVILITALILALSFVSCGAKETEVKNSGGNSQKPVEFESMTAETEWVPSFPEPKEQDAAEVYSKDIEADFAVISHHCAVTNAQFEALLNYVLILQLTPGDGEYDEYDGYFASGQLDRSGSVTGQTLPDSNVSWYADARSKALKISFDALKCFDLGEEKGVNSIDRLTYAKADKIIAAIKEREHGDDLPSLFGAEADEEVVRSAIILKIVSDFPTALTPYIDEIDMSAPIDFTFDQDLNPKVAPAISEYGG